MVIILLLILVFLNRLGLLHCLFKLCSGFESRHAMTRYEDRRARSNIPSNFVLALLQQERTKSTEINVLSLGHSFLHIAHKLLYYHANRGLI